MKIHSFYPNLKFLSISMRLRIAYFCEKYLGGAVQTDMFGDGFTEDNYRRIVWRKVWLIWDIKRYSFFFRLI